MTLLIPTMWLFPDLCLMVMPQPNHKQTFETPYITTPVFSWIYFQADRHGGRITLTI